MRRPQLLLVLVAVLTLAACEKPDAAPDYSGLYRVTGSPASQSCGNSSVTFTADYVWMIVVSNGTAVVTQWALYALPWFGDSSTSVGSLDGDRFAQNWTSTRTVPISCPATGTSSVVTTFTNAWSGTFGTASFDSTLAQTIDDDCGVISNCDLVWKVHGEVGQP